MNKLLITINVPLLYEKYEVYIPINKKMGTIKKILIETINELSENSLVNTENMNLYNKEDCKLYSNDIYVKDSNIHNGSVLILL